MPEMTSSRSPGGWRARAPALQTALPAGTRLDDFVIERLLDDDGVCLRYLATDLGPSRTVVLEEYLPSAIAARAADGVGVLVHRDAPADAFERGLQAFVEEARVLARCDHPSLLRYHRLVRTHGTVYRDRPWHAGTPLSILRDSMPAPPDAQALAALREALLGALAALHAQGAVHGHVRPETILLLDADDSPMLLGFDAARHALVAAGVVESGPSRSPYAAPETGPLEASAAVGAIGPWTDLHALALVLRYCLEGHPPAPVGAGRVPTAAVLADVAVRHPGLGYDDAFAAALDWALAPRPADRPASVAAWRAAFAGPAGRGSSASADVVAALAERLGDDEPTITEPLPSLSRDAYAAPSSPALAPPAPSSLAPPPVMASPGRGAGPASPWPVMGERSPDHRGAEAHTVAYGPPTMPLPDRADAGRPLAPTAAGDPAMPLAPPAPGDAAAWPAPWVSDVAAGSGVAPEGPAGGPAAGPPTGASTGASDRVNEGATGGAADAAAETAALHANIRAMLDRAIADAAIPTPPHAVEPPLRRDPVFDAVPDRGLGREPRMADDAPRGSRVGQWAVALLLVAGVGAGGWMLGSQEATGDWLQAMARAAGLSKAVPAVAPGEELLDDARNASASRSASASGGQVVAQPAPMALPTEPTAAGTARPPVDLPSAMPPVPTTTGSAGGPADDPAPPTSPPATATPAPTTAAPAPAPTAAPPEAGAPSEEASPDAPGTVPPAAAGPSERRVTPRDASAAPRRVGNSERSAESASRTPASPRAVCGSRTDFALYRCMQTQCRRSEFEDHAQCQRLRATDEVD